MTTSPPTVYATTDRKATLTGRDSDAAGAGRKNPQTRAIVFPTLRPYQQDAVQAVLQGLADGRRRGFIEMPTGAGKSVTLSAVAAHLSERGRVLVIAHRRELIEQLAATFARVFGDDAVGIVMGKRSEDTRPIIIASIQSLHEKRLARLIAASPEPLALVMLDECHHAEERNSYAHLLEACETYSPNVAVVGCSATPFRSDTASMHDVLPHCFYRITIAELQQARWLAPLRWQRVKLTGFSLGGLRTTKLQGERDFREDELAAALNRPSLNAAIVTATAEAIGERQAVVFAVNVAHAQALAACYEEAGIRAAAVWGAMPTDERTRVLSAWRAGELQLVVNCALLTEGFDYPGLSALVMARPTLSPVLYLQCVGRVTRTAPGKVDALVFDVCGGTDLTRVTQVNLPEVAFDALADDQREELQEQARQVERAARLERLQRDRKSNEQRARTAWGMSWLPWMQDPQTQARIAPVTAEDTIAWLPLPMGEEDATQRYRGYLISKDRSIGPVYGGDNDPVAAWDAVHASHYIVAQSATRRLVDKESAWRALPATPAQVKYLARLRRVPVSRVSHFTKGQAANAITLELVRPQIAALLAEGIAA